MAFKTIEWVQDRLRLIDQTLLPEQQSYIECRSMEEVYEAIQQMRVRGAPAIGITAAFGTVLGLQNTKTTDYLDFYQQAKKVTNYLRVSRPTAINLFHALNRMLRVVEQNRNMPVSDIKIALLTEAKMIYDDERVASQKIGDYGARLLPHECTILTHSAGPRSSAASCPAGFRCRARRRRAAAHRPPRDGR